MRRARRGATAVEFALVLPVLLAVVFGLMDGGWYMYQWLTVTTAAQQGARAGAGIATADDPEAVALDAVEARLEAYGLDPADAVVTAEVVEHSCGQVIDVVVVVPYDALIGFVIVPESLEARATACWYGDIAVGA